MKKVATSSADPLEALITNASGSQGHSSMVNLLTLQLLMMKKDDFPGDSQESGGRAFRRVHKMKGQVESEPESVVSKYVEEVIEHLGVEEGEAWQLHHWSLRVAWGRMQGLKRVHYHLSKILALSLKGKKHVSEAYTVRLLRATHQCCIDSGSWDSASLAPRKGPVREETLRRHGGRAGGHRGIPRGAEEAAEGQPALGAGGGACRRRRGAQQGQEGRRQGQEGGQGQQGQKGGDGRRRGALSGPAGCPAPDGSAAGGSAVPFVSPLQRRNTLNDELVNLVYELDLQTPVAAAVERPSGGDVSENHAEFLIVLVIGIVVL